MNCLLRHVMEGKIEVLGRRGRRHRQLLGIRKETRKCCKLKEKELALASWTKRFGRGYGPVVRESVD